MRTAGLDTSARVTGLYPNTKYHVTVRAYNRAGTGPASPSADAMTMKPRECLPGLRKVVCHAVGTCRGFVYLVNHSLFLPRGLHQAEAGQGILLKHGSRVRVLGPLSLLQLLDFHGDSLV